METPIQTTSVENTHLLPGQEAFLKDVQNTMETLVESEAVDVLKELSLYQIKNPGKKLRSKLIYSLSVSLGVKNLDELVLWACANELMHEATLIHDDIQDDDDTRRGKPALWKVYGVAQAINVGDFLLLLSVNPLTKLNSMDLLSLHNKTSFQLANGQAEEIRQTESKLTLEDNFYINCIEKKTAALFSCLAEGVGHILKLDKKQIQEIGEVFLKLGCIFQMQDDILDLYGDKGRELCGCDIKEGKFSFLIHTHLINHRKDQDKILHLLSKDYDKTTQEEIEDMKTHFVKSGTLNSALDNLQKEINALKRYAKNTTALKDKGSTVEMFVESIIKPISHLLK